MDSLTQLTFGATVGHALLGEKVGKRAIVWGAVLGTLPDLDVFLPVNGPVEAMVDHRGFSHSLFLLALLSPVVAYLLTLVHPQTKKLFFRWVLFCFVVFEGSVLLDYLTIYGTQILWPFDKTPLSLPVLFIIDPILTIPLCVGFFGLVLDKKGVRNWSLINRYCVSFSLMYLLVAMLLGRAVEYRVKEKLMNQNVKYSQVVASPAPFTTLLWRVVGISEKEYFETYYSVFDGDAPLIIDFHPQNNDLLRELNGHRPVEKLRRFTRGYYSMTEKKGEIIMTDLRMGSEPDYVFQFKVGERNNKGIQPTKDEEVEVKQDWGRLKWIWKRIWEPIPQETGSGVSP